MRTWLALLAPLLLAAPAHGFPLGGAASGLGTLAIDGTPVQTTSTTQTVVPVVSTTLANDVIVLMTRSGPTGVSGPTIASVTDTAGLTWVRRAAYAYNAPYSAELEEWYAVSPGVLTADSVTITMNTATSYANRVMAFAVSGANTTTPFDPNGALPATNSGAAGATSLTASYTTTKPADMLLAVLSTPASFGTVTRPSGYAAIVASGSNTIDYSYLTVSAAQSAASKTWSWTTGVTGAVGIVADALQAAGQ